MLRDSTPCCVLCSGLACSSICSNLACAQPFVDPSWTALSAEGELTIFLSASQTASASQQSKVLEQVPLHFLERLERPSQAWCFCLLEDDLPASSASSWVLLSELRLLPQALNSSRASPSVRLERMPETVPLARRWWQSVQEASSACQHQQELVRPLQSLASFRLKLPCSPLQRRQPPMRACSLAWQLASARFDTVKGQFWSGRIDRVVIAIALFPQPEKTAIAA